MASERVGVVGAGIIGLELGSVWRRLGAEVTVVEFLDQILPGFDDDIRKESNKIFKKQGMTFMLGTKVTGATASDTGVSLTIEPAKGGDAQTLEADVVLVSIGRRPNTDGLALDKAGLAVNPRGQIETDHEFRTKVAGIWAIGDVVPGPMLAHKASDEGIAVAENIAGLTGIVNHDVIPSVVYTWPEIAGVGLTEAQAREKGEVKVGKFPMLGNSRAKTNHEPDGFVKIIADAKTDRVLGVWAIAVPAGTMIAEAALAMEFGATYPYEDTTPFALGVDALRAYRGSHGMPLRDVPSTGIMSFLPSYAVTKKQDELFPDWKIRFIRQNREFYAENKKWIDPWLPKLAEFPPSLQKLEWNCKGDKRDIWSYVIQFRASGVRVKRRTTAPSLVAMTTTQVPIIAWEKRYMTVRECARLQSMAGLKHLPKATEAAYSALGNAVNVQVAKRVASALLDSPLSKRPRSRSADPQRALRSTSHRR